MSYLKSGLLFLPLIALVVLAQEPPSALKADPEADLRARAEKFFQMQVDKKYRPAEAMVADDTKDDYYNGRKFAIDSFTIEKIEMEGKDHAKITIKAGVKKIVPGYGPVNFDARTETAWKIEDGEWRYYIDKSAAQVTPFGVLKPGPGDPNGRGAIAAKIADLSTLQNAVKLDRNAVSLSAGGPVETVTVTNELPGAVDLSLQSSKIEGLKVELGKSHLEANEKAVIRLSTTSSKRSTGIVRLSVKPIGMQLDVRLNLN